LKHFVANIAQSSHLTFFLSIEGGNLINRPTDIRMYAMLPLPEEWKEDWKNCVDGVCPGFNVRKALLTIDHLITNNPNDQIRPEDLENEGATGRKPNYYVDENERWRSMGDCFEGDADLIEGGDTDGVISSTFIPGGTIMKQNLKKCGLQGSDPPNTPSEDLFEGFTNA
jgi:hypothetical protein